MMRRCKGRCGLARNKGTQAGGDWGRRPGSSLRPASARGRPPPTSQNLSCLHQHRSELHQDPSRPPANDA